MKEVTEDTMQKLFESTVSGIQKRIESEEACAADFNAAIALLKLNNITVNPETSESVNKLRDKLEEKRERRKARVAGNGIVDALTEEESKNILQFKKAGE